jgi:hypothetical protein
MIAMAVGIATMALVVFAGRLTPLLPWLAPAARVAWPWYVLIGTSLTLVVGVLSSFTHAAPPDKAIAAS